MPKEWQPAAVDLKAAKRIAKSLDLSLPASKILVSRGLKTMPAVRSWLEPDLKDLESPQAMAGVPEAVERILRAAETGDKIVVFGDFDVDGMTATAVMLNILEALGAPVEAILPDRRRHGYGLSGDLIKQAAQDGAALLITVDCGITNEAEVALAKELGLDVVIVDHHEPPPSLPPADIIINPRQPGCPYKFKDLAAVGLAFRLAQAIGARAGLEKEALAQLDLVALGTIADLVPLVGENRILAVHGIRCLEKARRPGLTGLIEVSGLAGTRLSAGQISFGLAPRLNAAGRLKSARAGLDLLRANDPKVAKRLAIDLNDLNDERRKLEEKMTAQAVAAVEDEGLKSSIVLASPDWHDGVKGIVASRLVERYFRPTILFSVVDDKYIGSGRSIPGLNIYEALSECAPLLEKWGGHQGAAGLTVAADKWSRFRERFEEVVRGLLDETDFVERLKIDLDLSPDEINERFVRELELLAPFGRGNPTPVFSLRNVYADDYRELSGGRHLRFLAQAGDLITEAVAFRVDGQGLLMKRERLLDIALQLSRREFRGRTDLQFKVIDARLADPRAPNKEASVRVPQSGGGFFLPMDEAGGPAATRFSFVDQRDRDDKDDWLKEFLSFGLPCAVYVRDEFEGVQLANRLEKSQVEVGGDLFIICSSTDPGADTGRLIFYQAPLSARALRAVCAGGAGAPDRKIVYFLYDRQDLELARETMDSLCPSRALLADIYRLLKEDGPFNLDEAAAIVRLGLGDSLYPPATRQATGRVIKVLAELRLLDRDEDGKFTMADGPVKADLELSPSWRRMAEQRREFENFLKNALTGRPDRLFR